MVQAFGQQMGIIDFHAMLPTKNWRPKRVNPKSSSEQLFLINQFVRKKINPQNALGNSRKTCESKQSELLFQGKIASLAKELATEFSQFTGKRRSTPYPASKRHSQNIWISPWKTVVHPSANCSPTSSMPNKRTAFPPPFTVQQCARQAAVSAFSTAYTHHQQKQRYTCKNLLIEQEGNNAIDRFGAAPIKFRSRSHEAAP